MYNKIVLAGGTGFLGNVLVDYYQDKAKEIVILNRRTSKTVGNVRFVKWEVENEVAWIIELENSDLLVNLCGKNVNCRYTLRNQKEILESRTRPTEALGKAMKSLKNPPRLWINAGSATIYRHAEDRCQDEYGGELGTGFSIEVCKAWEESFWKWKTPGTRKIALRIGMVLGSKDSVFPYLRRLVYSGLGGYQGMGNQYISWIHQQDFARATEWLVQNEELEGVFNCTAPASVRNRFFMKQMRQTYGIPVGVPMPKWLLEIGAVIMRTETELVLKSRWVYPRRLLESGFQFSFPNAEMAIHELASQRV